MQLKVWCFLSMPTFLPFPHNGSRLWRCADPSSKTLLQHDYNTTELSASDTARSVVLAAPELVQRTNPLLEPFLASDPELLALLHDIREHRATEEDHVLPAWGVLDADLKFLYESIKVKTSITTIATHACAGRGNEKDRTYIEP